MTTEMSTAPAAIPDTSGSEQTRRDFLYVATATVAAIGTVAATWPLIDQMNPDAGTVAVVALSMSTSAIFSRDSR
jgi:Rieske Fe-S protein